MNPIPNAGEAPARGPIVKALDTLLDRILTGKLNGPTAGQAVRRLVHSDFVGGIVRATPTPADDVVLELLRELVPKPA